MRDSPNIYWDTTSSSCLRCPLPFHDNTLNGYTGCFVFAALSKSWTECKSYCQSMNGNILNLETQQKFDCARDYLFKVMPNAEYYYWVRLNKTYRNRIFNYLN